VVIALPVDEEVDDLRHFAVLDHRTQAHDPDIVERDLHSKAAGFDPEQVEFQDIGTDCPAVDLFDHPYAVVRINNFVADFETQMTIHETPERGIDLRRLR
jgi:hypothetical protein